MKKKLYMIGNAHLDPVWQWRWSEGVAAVKQTIQAALDRMDENDDFVFTSSQAVMYRWLSECAPGMIEKIRERVAEGRFVICGGQYVQPDCNTPSGESFVRHSLYSQRMFKRLLGTTAKTAYNVDSFGHNAMLPQIFRKSGLEGYVMMRPGQHEKALLNNVFLWRSPDGTELPVFRIAGGYGGNYKSLDDVRNDINETSDSTNADLDITMVFYGVGNHGGGPTKKNIALVKEIQKELCGEAEVIFSDPTTFFDDLKKSGYQLPVLEDDLQHHASGCYSTVSELKRLNRRLEADLFFAEAYASITNKLLSLEYPRAKFEEAWENVLFNQFHDSMGGCSFEKVYEDAFAFAGEAQSIASKSIVNSTQALSWAVDTIDLPGTPIIVFNPHPWTVKAPVQINFSTANIKDLSGNIVPTQAVHSQAESCMWRDDILFSAEIPPMGYTTYLVEGRTEETISWTNIGDSKSRIDVESPVKAEVQPELQTSNDHKGPAIENEYLRVEICPYRGWILSMKDKETGEELINDDAGVPVVIDEYSHDTWSHAKNFFDKEIAVFSDAVCTVVESGPVRATIKAVSRYNDSTLTQYFSLVQGEKMLRVRAICDWREKHKMLKISNSCMIGEPLAADYEIPFSHFARPCDGEEENGHRYVVVRGSKRSMAMLNDSKYSFSVKGDDMRLTVLRSPIYGDHGGPRTSESEFTEQGRSEFGYALMPCAAEPDYAAIERRAAEFNSQPVPVSENNHKGYLAPTASFVSVDADDIDITAFKRSEDDNGWIIRAYETAGHDTDAVISLPILGAELPLHFGKFEVRTILIPDIRSGVENKEPHEVMMTEWEY